MSTPPTSDAVSKEITKASAAVAQVAGDIQQATALATQVEADAKAAAPLLKEIEAGCEAVVQFVMKCLHCKTDKTVPATAITEVKKPNRAYRVAALCPDCKSKMGVFTSKEKADVAKSVMKVDSGSEVAETK